MFYIQGGDIYIHRGDSASFDIVFGESSESDAEYQILAKDVYGINWIPENGTHIRFSIKCDVGREKALIQKDYVVWNGFVCIDLETKDTRSLPFGEYVWDVCLSFPDADIEDWNTPFNPFTFTVCDVVGNKF